MIKVLLKKQLMEIWRGFFYDQKHGVARSTSGIIGMALLYFVLIGGVLCGGLGSFAYGMCAILCEAGLGWFYFLLASVLSLVLGVFGSVFSTYAGLYLSKDNDLLLSMPIPIRSILFARLLGVYLMGLFYSVLVFIPFTVVYFISNPFSVTALIGSVGLGLVVSLTVLVLSCLLGWVVAKISQKLKNKSFITVLVSLCGIAIYYVVYFKFVNGMQDFLLQVVSTGEQLTKSHPILSMIGSAGTGNLLSLGILTGIVLLLLSVVYFILDRTFLRIATDSAAVSKIKAKKVDSKVRSLSSALSGKEFGRFFASPNYMLNCGLGVILIPAIGILLLVKGRALVLALGGVFGSISGSVESLFLAALCMAASMNDMTAASVSLEGKSVWILQSLPVSFSEILKAKLKPQLLLTSPVAFFASVCALIVMRPDLLWTVTIVVFPQIFLFFMAILGLFLNLKKHDLNWTNEIYPIKQSMAITVMLFGGWLYALLVGGGALLLGSWIPPIVYIGCIALLTVVASCVLFRWMMKNGTRIFLDL